MKKACDYFVFIFYFFLNIFTIASLYQFSKDYFSRFSITFHIIFFSNVIIAYYLYMTVRKDPGVIKIQNSDNINTEHIAFSINSVTTDRENTTILDKQIDEEEQTCDKCKCKKVILQS